MMKEKIGNCFPYIKNGLNIKQDKNKGGIPITRIETLSNDRFNRDKMGYADIFDVEKYSDRILCDGDILMSHINSSRYLGRAVLYQKQNNENIIHGVNLLRLKADRSIVYPNYAAKFFASRYFKKQVASITKKAVNQASFSIAALKELEIQLPDLDTQKRIAQNFEKISNCIFTLEEYLNKLDDLVKSRFVEMFGNADSSSANFNTSTINEICSSIVRGPFGSALKKEFFIPGGVGTYKVYEQKHAIRKRADIGTYYISKEKFDSLKRFECKPGDILMSCSGTMGELYQLPMNCEPGIINQALCKFTLNEKILPEYFFRFMSQVVDDLGAKGSGIKNVSSVKYIKDIKIPLPPLSLQQEFAAFVHQVDKLKFETQQSIEKLQMLYDSLAQEYFAPEGD